MNQIGQVGSQTTKFRKEHPPSISQPVIPHSAGSGLRFDGSPLSSIQSIPSYGSIGRTFHMSAAYSRMVRPRDVCGRIEGITDWIKGSPHRRNPSHLCMERAFHRHSFIIIIKGMSFAPQHSSFSVILVPFFAVLDSFCFLFPAFRATSRAGKIQGEEPRLFRRTKDKRISTLDTYKGHIIHGKQQ